MDELKTRIVKLRNKFNIEGEKKRIRKIEAESASSSFWQDHKTASKKMKELSDLQKEISKIEKLEELISSGNYKEAEILLKKLEIMLYFSSPYDMGSAILSIHSGQGGVEAMDWAAMLYRMYSRFFERKNWSFEVIEETFGEEAGIKSITLEVNGKYAYGFLKNEAGVHRLVRQSPFNADRLRQTSFALVEVMPDIEDNTEINIKENELEWEFYRTSSHGGQNVQKVSSAVRLTHKPTGTVVTAQSERYQGQNRENALKLLMAKLWTKEEEERKKEDQRLRGEYKTPGWGNQIRSYVLHPYHMVKDLRTSIETSNTEGVLNGDLDRFIEAEIQQLP